MTGSFRALGLMSGTSMDGIDVAVIETDGETVERRGAGATTPYTDTARGLIRKAAADARSVGSRAERPASFAAAEEAVTRAHAGAIASFLATNDLRASDIDVIGFHGQTVVHRPDKGFTVQLGDGQMLADAAGAAVVYDLRGADMAAGGQGAPLVPVYHRALAASSGLEPPLVVVNIGGVANVTWIGPAGALLAFDVGPGNALVDEWAERHTGETMDRNGALARRGSVDAKAVEAFFAHPFFELPPPKSLDRADFSLSAVAGLAASDGAATLVAITAEAIARAGAHMPQAPCRWVISGGGAFNPVLMDALRGRLPGRVETARSAGWSAEFMEAEAFAYLAVRSRLGLPITFPETTGVAAPTTGGVAVSPSAGRR